MVGDRQGFMTRAYMLPAQFSPAVAKTVGYLEEYWARPLTLDELSDLIGIEKSDLCHRFKRETGVTIHWFLDQIRLTNAIELLMSSDLPVAEISDKLGFVSTIGATNQKYFATWFKKSTGLSPTAYRKNHDSRSIRLNESRSQVYFKGIFKAVNARQEQGPAVVVPDAGGRTAFAIQNNAAARLGRLRTPRPRPGDGARLQP